MEKSDFLLYVEAALKELHYGEGLRFTVEGALVRMLRIYSVEEIRKKVKRPTFYFEKEDENKKL